MTDMDDWADKIVGGVFSDHSKDALYLSAGQKTIVAKLLRKAKADGEEIGELRGRAKGWREAGNYVVQMAKDADNEIQGAAFIEAGFELIGEADELDKLESSTD